MCVSGATFMKLNDVTTWPTHSTAHHQ